MLVLTSYLFNISIIILKKNHNFKPSFYSLKLTEIYLKEEKKRTNIYLNLNFAKITDNT